MRTLSLLPLTIPLFTGLNAQDLRVDFTDTGGAVETGYEGYFADHEASATFTTQAFTAHGATINITPLWGDDTVSPPVDGTSVALDGVNTAKQLIVRPEEFPSTDLYKDWIGLDGRTSPANPFSLLIEGLPAGSYTLASHHHDPNNQTGVIELTITDANGASSPFIIDQSSGADTPTVAITQLTSDGSEITLSFSNVLAAGGNTTPVIQVFTVLNAIEIFVDDDTDGDGLPNAYETANELDLNDDGTTGESTPGAKDGPNGALGDPDSDNLTNLQEFQGGDGIPSTGDETKPQDFDTDGDGLDDGEEVSGSANENFGDEPTNPLKPDSDDDGLSDFDEIDGALNDTFSFEATNPNKADTDDDGIPDLYEIENNEGGGLDPNTDDAADDLDEDTLSNIDEFNGVPSGFQTRADNEDTDDDGLEDNVETGSGVWVNSENTGTNPTLIDTDRDGLEDGQEDPDTTTGFGSAPFPSNPNIFDTDNDSINDGIEAANGTDGSDPNSFPELDLGSAIVMISDLSPAGSPIEEFFNNNFSNITEIRHGNFADASATESLDALNGTGVFAGNGPANILVIGRSLSSPDYQEGAADAYNVISIPIINFTSYTARETGNRLGWHAGGAVNGGSRNGDETTVTDAGANILRVAEGTYDFYTDDPDFNGLGLGTGVGGGDILATINGNILAAHWDAGDAPGNTAIAGVETFPGTRLLFNLDNEPGTGNDGTNDLTGMTPAGIAALVSAIDITTPLKAATGDSTIAVISSRFTAPNTVTVDYQGEANTTYSLNQTLSLQGDFTATGDTNTTDENGAGTFSFTVDITTNPKQFFQISSQ